MIYPIAALLAMTLLWCCTFQRDCLHPVEALHKPGLAGFFFARNKDTGVEAAQLALRTTKPSRQHKGRRNGVREAPIKASGRLSRAKVFGRRAMFQKPEGVKA